MKMDLKYDGNEPNIANMRPDIAESMNDCTTVYKAYWEAIRVEYMLKLSPLGKVAPQTKSLNHHN